MFSSKSFHFDNENDGYFIPVILLYFIAMLLYINKFYQQVY